MGIRTLRLLSLVFVLSGLGVANNDLPAPEVIDTHAETYVNLQLCSNTYSEYRNSPQQANLYLDESLKIQKAYVSDEQLLDAFVMAIQRAHDRQGSLVVYPGESREAFYTRVFSESRCEQELKLASTFRF